MASLRPALLHALGHLSRVKFARDFARAAPDPRGTQEAKLRQLLSANAGTEYGAQHGFQSLKSPQEFAQRVPLMTPADLEPLVRRQMEGARNVLTAEPPVYYVRTTGSTGVPKHVPITRAYVNEFQRTVHVSLFHLRRLVPSAFLGRALYFVGSRRVAKAPDGCDVGTMSGFNFTEMPQVVRAVYAWPYELFEVQDLRARTLLSLVLAALGDVSLIAGIFPAPIVYLLRDLDAQAGVLARILRDGKLPSDLALTSVQRSFFEGLLKGPRRSLAQRMDRAASAPEGSRVPIALPSLRLVYCWTTATAGLYVPELQRRVGERVLVRDAIYSACEGWCSIPMGEAEPGGALATTSHFYEFIPEDAFEQGSRETKFAWELEDGRRYLIVLTTGAGLSRYLLGDVIEVCGFHGKTPRIRFVRKSGAASNLAGEKLDESHVNRAVGAALSAMSLEATFFTLAPALPGPANPGRDRPGYALLLEPRQRLDEPAARALADKIDLALGDASFDYGRLRKGNMLLPLTLVQLDAGAYDRVRQRKVAEGSAEAQLKIAHLTGDAGSLADEMKTALEAALRTPR